jgi:hypothetical protein
MCRSARRVTLIERAALAMMQNTTMRRSTPRNFHGTIVSWRKNERGPLRLMTRHELWLGGLVTPRRVS